jgi:hypothetical protein
MASLDGRKPPTQRITNRGLCLTQATMTMIKHNPMNDPPPKKHEKIFPGNKKPRFWDYKHFIPILLHPPKTRKAFSQKQETPILGLQTFHPYFVAPPKNTKSFFPETRNPDFGTTNISSLFCCTPQKHEKLFPGNKKPRFWDMPQPKWAEMDRNGAHGLIFAFMNFTNFAPCMVSRLCAGKSSAIYLVPRVFAQKGFAISIFGHFFCPFSENFIESCRVKTKNNKIILPILLYNMRA